MENEKASKPFNYEPLRRFMRRSGKTWNDIKNDCGLQDSTITRLRGDIFVNVQTISKICIYLSIPITDVVEINYSYLEGEYSTEIPKEETIERIPEKPRSLRDRYHCQRYKGSQCHEVNPDCEKCKDFRFADESEPKSPRNLKTVIIQGDYYDTVAFAPSNEGRFIPDDKPDDELTSADFFEMMTDRPHGGKSSVFKDLDWINKHGNS